MACYNIFEYIENTMHEVFYMRIYNSLFKDFVVHICLIVSLQKLYKLINAWVCDYIWKIASFNVISFTCIKCLRKYATI